MYVPLTMLEILGVVNVGLVARTFEPEPVVVPEEPVPPFAAGRIPVTPVVKGSPVALVSVTLEGVPKFGVVRTGLLESTILPVPVTPLDKLDAETATLPPKETFCPATVTELFVKAVLGMLESVL